LPKWQNFLANYNAGTFTEAEYLNLISGAAANTRQRDEDGSNRQKAKRILFENNFNRSCTDNIFELFY